MVNVEVAKLISFLISSNDVHEITQLVLLQELLGQVLQVTLGEVDVTDDGNLGIGAADFDGGGELAGLAVDLELVVQEVFLQEFFVGMRSNGNEGNEEKKMKNIFRMEMGDNKQKQKTQSETSWLVHSETVINSKNLRKQQRRKFDQRLV